MKKLSSLLVSIAFSTICIAQEDVNSTGYSIGDYDNGGIVFWLDETGKHGLVCAKSDQSSEVRWHSGAYGYTNAIQDGPFTGDTNTAIIIASQVVVADDSSTYAARVCNELQVVEGGEKYHDWYLPSKEELNKMGLNQPVIDSKAKEYSGNTFAEFDYYWSSTDADSLNAWAQIIGFDADKISKGQRLYLRCVRSF